MRGSGGVAVGSRGCAPVTRRASFSAAAVAAGLTLCGCSGAALSTLGIVQAPRLRIGLVGFPNAVGDGLAQSLQECGKAYARHGGRLRLAIQSHIVPEMGWYDCGGKPCSPASVVPVGLLTGGPDSSAPQIQVGTAQAPNIVYVAGRTSLGIHFGAPLPSPAPASLVNLRAGGPDLIIGYSTWAYWLALLATPLGDAAKLYPEYLSGLSPGLLAHGDFFAPDQGLAPLALPLLRNPMALFFSAPAAAARAAVANPQWTWDGFATWLRHAGSAVSAGGFMWTQSYPEGTETALAMLSAYGGALGTVRAGNVLPGYTGSGAEAGLRTWSQIVTGETTSAEGSPPNASPPSGGGSAVVAQHLWSPLWANRFQWTPTWLARPLPAGPRGRRVPCTYLCAFVSLGNTAGSLANEFAAFLMSSVAQPLIGGASVGLPVRHGDVVATAAKWYPWLLDAATFADGNSDLSLTDLFGDLSGVKDGDGVATVNDGFAAHLAAVQAPLIAAQGP